MDTKHDVTGAADERAPAVVPGTGAGVRSDTDRWPVLVLGYGNTLRRDDGVGVRAAELMAADPRFAGVEVLTAYQLTPELSLDIARASLVVFVDADVRGLPGAIEVRELGASGSAAGHGSAVGVEADHQRADPGASSHHVGADEVMALARELSGASPRALAVGVGVADLELGEGLSAPVEAALPRVVDVVARCIAGNVARRAVEQRPA
jgi:hydrogenase maturation protease